MRLRDYLELARQRAVVVVAVVLATVLAVSGLLLLQSPQYTASVRLRARPPAPGSSASDIIQQNQEQTDLATEAQLVRSSKVAHAVATELHLTGKPDDLLKKVSVVALGNSAVLNIEARADKGPQAIALANAFANEYLNVRRKTLAADLTRESDQQSNALRQRLDRLQQIDGVLARAQAGSAEAIAAGAERDQVVADITVIRAKIDALSDQAAISAGFGEIIQNATESKSARSQSLPRAAVFGLLLGVPLALATVLVLDGLSNDVRTRQDVERLTGSDLIGVIPTDTAWTDASRPRLVTSIAPLSPAAEAYRTLSFALARYAQDAGATSVLITSPGDGDGKTAMVANVAVAAADTGRSTRVVEADLRHPRLHSFFETRSEPGVADVLAGEVPVDDAMIELGYGLEFIPAGRASERPDLLTARGDLRAMLNGTRPPPDGRAARPVRARAASSNSPSWVLIDSASILEAGEVAQLASQADAVVLVARARVTSKQALSAAAEQVRRVGGSLLGVVLVGVRSVAESGGAGNSGFVPASSGTSASD